MSSQPSLAPVGVDLVWFSGTDSVRFLNDIISQEIATMSPGQTLRSLLLGARGKLDHLLWVLRGSDLVGLATDEGRGAELASTLGRYRIRVDVAIEPETRPMWVVMNSVTASGTWSADRTSSLDADISWRASSRMLVAGERPDLEQLGEDEYLRARILSGEPAWGVDVDEATIPQETGLAEATIDFGKGCFLGQELVGRIHSRGHVNRHLRIVELEGPAEPGSEVTLEGVSVGVLTSVAADVGLGLIRREVSPGDEVTVGGATAVVRALSRESS